MNDWATKLSQDLNLSNEQTQVLRGMAQAANTQSQESYMAQGSSMETVATQMGTVAKAATDATAAKRAQVPAGGPSNQVDSGGASAPPTS